MLSLNYNYLTYAGVSRFADLISGISPKEEGVKVNSLYTTVKSMFGVSNIILNVAQERNVYKFNIMDQATKKYLIGYIVYIPDERRIDIWDSSNPGMPLIQFQGKKIVHQGYSELMQCIKLDTLFVRLLNIL